MRPLIIGVATLFAFVGSLPAQSPSRANNTITAVPGIKVGHHTLVERPTGAR